MNKNRAYSILVVIILVSLLSGCRMNVPGAAVKATATSGPADQQTANPTDVLGQIYGFATQTAIAELALGTPVPGAEQTTPGAPAATLPAVEGQPVVPEAPVQPQPAAATPLPALPAPTQGPPPASYTLQKNEFPFCIARRFNVDPAELLSLNGLSSYSVYYAGMDLRIPQTGRTFPGNRALMAHPTTYIVAGGESIYSIACAYGDVDPVAIAAVNGLQPPYKLSAGMTLNIP